KINKDELEKVGDLVDVDSNNLANNGFRKNITLVYYYLIQFGFFIFSSLVGLGFGLYGNSLSFYPYSAFPQRYLYGSIILALTHGGNLGLSNQLSRKKRLIMSKREPKELSPFYIFPAIVLNIILSSISLFSIHHLVTHGSPMTINTLYGVYFHKNLNIKNLSRIKNTKT
ncbi:MAG: hypothetical protein ACTSQ4_01305, partial [Candidatus Heimdallarchaeaceae archaeon]